MPKEKSPRSSGSSFGSLLKSAIRTTFSTLFLFIALFVVMSIFQGIQEQPQACEESSAKILNTENFAHNRSWKGLDGDNYCLNYQARADKKDDLASQREELHVPRSYWSTDNGYWGYIYQELASQNSEAVAYIADSLMNVGQQRSLNRSATAELMVTFVQDIPYVLITNKPCAEDYQGPCRANETYGILSPYEFLYSLEGDCDTRSVLLYALLKHAGYHPIIVVSEEYAHAMIALDVAATGDYIEYQRQRFYFWETTSHGWKPGMLPPSTNNVQYWKIALAHEF